MLYLDLDMIIVRDLVKYFESNDQLSLISNNYYLNGKIYSRINTSMMYWNADDAYFATIYETYLLNKEAYDSNKYLDWISTSDIGDQQVILDSELEFRFFPSQGIRFFKYLINEKNLAPEVDLIVCKGKKQEDYFQHPIVQKFWN